MIFVFFKENIHIQELGFFECVLYSKSFKSPLSFSPICLNLTIKENQE